MPSTLTPIFELEFFLKVQIGLVPGVTFAFMTTNVISIITCFVKCYGAGLYRLNRGMIK